MSKRSYRQVRNDDGTTTMVEITRQRSSGHFIIDDTIEFKSPVTGEMITSRAQMNKHLKQHDLTPFSDFTDSWKKSEAKREAIARGELRDPKRVEDIQRAMYRLEHGYKDFPDVAQHVRELD